MFQNPANGWAVGVGILVSVPFGFGGGILTGVAFEGREFGDGVSSFVGLLFWAIAAALFLLGTVWYA